MGSDVKILLVYGQICIQYQLQAEVGAALTLLVYIVLQILHLRTPQSLGKENHA